MPSDEIPAEFRRSTSESPTNAIVVAPPATPPIDMEDVDGAHGEIPQSLQPSPVEAGLPAALNDPSPAGFVGSPELNDFSRPYLLPVVLPVATGPTLEQLLYRVTGRTDLDNVENVTLRVISYMVSLSRLSVFLPRLTYLDLSGSVLESLRELGYTLLNLKFLNVSNCGLSSFDGASGIPAVETLFADGNMVQLVGPLVDLPHLQYLSARFNRISELSSLTFLGMCPNLVQLDLEGNPVTYLNLYRLTLLRHVRYLELLDGEPLFTANELMMRMTGLQLDEDEEDEDDAIDVGASSYSNAGNVSRSSSEESLSSMESTFELAKSLVDLNNRPSTTCSLRYGQQYQQPNKRSTSLSDFGCVTSANTRRSLLSATSPFAGSVLDLVRQPNRRSRSNDEPASFNSSSSAPVFDFLKNNRNDNETKDNCDSADVLQSL